MTCDLVINRLLEPSYDESLLFQYTSTAPMLYILKTKSYFTLLLYIPFLGIGEWYLKCV